MQTYYAFFEPGLTFATVRHGNDGGVTDMEFEHGIRCYCTKETNERKLEGQLLDDGFELLNKEDWNNFIGSLDDPGVTSNDHYINSRPKPDKWNNSREIY